MAAVIALDSTNFVHHFLVILLLLIIPWAAPLSFDFPTFQQSDLTNGTGLLITEADAVIANQFIRLTKDLGGEKTNGSVGRATYGEPFLLRDKATGKLADFNTSFTFRFYARNATALFYDQGLAFFLAPNGSLLNRALGVGGSMSVPANSSVENATEPSNEYPFVAVEFDTSRNSRPTMEDPGSGHVGIDINSVKSSITKPWNSGIVEGKLNRVWISYNSSSKNISVSLTTYANDTRRQVITSLSYLVDLNEYLLDWVVVGFSASTGAAPALIDIMSWNFTSTSLVGDGSLALSNQEKKGQSLVPSAQTIKDESLVPEPSPRSNVKSRRRKKRMGVVISSAIGGFILACILALGLYNSCKKRATGGRADIDLTIPNELGEKISQKKFSYKELATATRNFSDGELLGVGRHGAFYKGYIKELNIYVAVKKIPRRSELVPKEHASEVRIISELHHRNLVQLVGWCHKKGELLLVYEFMPNGSLDYYLFKEHISLVWEVRYKIAQGLASGLLYLHEDYRQCLLHRGIASSNVMLDSNFNAKLGDFRLAWHLYEKHSDSMPLAPEYAATQRVTKEFDVYSFGVVALEISCGRKAIEPRLASGRVNIIEWVWELYGQGKIIEAADPKLCRFDGKQIECLLIVGLWCAHPDYHFRPSILQAIQVLNFEVPLPILPLRTPMSTSPPDISLSSSSSSTTSFQENSGSSGHGDMDNTNSFLPEPVIESWDPSEPVTVVLHPESNIATVRQSQPAVSSTEL
ncbi:unnamed protein product [Malus baccata var. baccata]